MKIQTRCFIGIVPVFIALAAAVSVTVGYLEHKETIWGLKEEAGGLAVSVAQFMDRPDLVMLARGQLDQTTRNAFFKPLNRVLRARSASRIFAVEPGSGRVLLDIGPQASSNLTINLPAEALDASAKDAEFVDAVMTDTKWGDIMTAYAPVTTQGGKLAAIVGVQIDASAAATQLRETRHELFNGVAATVLAGLLCSLIISTVLGRSVSSLTRAAAAAAAGQYDALPTGSRTFIREMKDLWNTFETLISVLKGVLSKGRRELLDTEVFRNEKDLVEIFDNTFMKDAELRRGDVIFSVRSFREGSAGALMDVVEANGKIMGIVGQVAQMGGVIQTKLTASAAMSYIRQQLLRMEEASAMASTAALFSFDSLKVISSDEKGGSIATFEYDAKEKRTASARIELPAGAVRYVHNLGAEADRRISLYVGTFHDRPAKDLINDVMRVISAIEPRSAGALAFVAREDRKSD